MAATEARKVYDFKMEPVKSKLVLAFKQRRNESTIADLAAATGLPTYQVQSAARSVLDEYGGHCKVTESGEILYYFPRGMHSRTKGFLPRLKRIAKGLLSVLGKFLAFLLKVWIMVMLVGYFILFLVLVLAAVLAMAAGSANSKSRRGPSNPLPIGRLIEGFLRIFFWVRLTQPGRVEKKPGRPLYKSIFGFIFGEADPNSGWEERERINGLGFIRSQKGVVTSSEIMALTGRDAEEANLLLNSWLVAFEGEPSVTADGSLYYFFPELLRTKREEWAGMTDAGKTEYKIPIPFSTNSAGTSAAIVLINLVNLLFGSYFTYFASLTLAGNAPVQGEGLAGLYTIINDVVLQGYLGLSEPALGVLIILGLVPLFFSIVLFIIPFIRGFFLRARNEKIKQENLRKRIMAALRAEPEYFNPSLVKKLDGVENPARAAEFIRHEVDRLAADSRADVEESENGTVNYNFKELKRELADMTALRKTIDLSKYEVGKTVFDTNE